MLCRLINAVLSVRGRMAAYFNGVEEKLGGSLWTAERPGASARRAVRNPLVVPDRNPRSGAPPRRPYVLFSWSLQRALSAGTPRTFRGLDDFFSAEI
jgi:hypothetical protein